MKYQIWVHFENETKFYFEKTFEIPLKEFFDDTYPDDKFSFSDDSGRVIYICMKTVTCINAIPMKEQENAIN